MESDRKYFSFVNDVVNSDAYNKCAVGQVVVVTFDDPSKDEVYEFVTSRLAKDGYCLMQYMGKSKHHQKIYEKMLAKLFGDPVSEKFSGGRAYTNIQSKENAKFYVNSNVAQPIHTDEGHALEYPKYVALYCEKEAGIGGDSIIVPLHNLLISLTAEYGEDVNLLYMKDALTVQNYQGEKNKPILIKFNNGDVGISFSSVLYKVKCSERVFEMFDFIARYVHAVKNQIRFKLHERQLLVLNNCSVLHGRTSFLKSDPRLLYRYWYKWHTL